MTDQINNRPVSLENVEAAMDRREVSNSTSSKSSNGYLLGGGLVSILILLGVVIWLAVERNNYDTPGIEACVTLKKYPGYLGNIDVSGKVCLQESGVGFVYDYNFRNLPSREEGGWHVHSGTSCENSEGHFFDGLDVDPWKTTKWVSNRFGVSKSRTDMRFTPLNVLGRTIVVHAPDGTRIACGEIPGEPHQHTKPPTMSPTRLPTGDANCRDSLQFSDPNGNTCRDWVGYNCEVADRYIKLGRRGTKQKSLSKAAKRELLKNCPASCGTCTPSFPALVPDELCRDNEAFRDEVEDRCHDWLGYNCYQAAQNHGLSFSGQNDLLANCPASCGLCNPLPHHPTNIPPNQCRDNPSWEEDDDNSCKNLIGTNCYFAPHAYDDDDVTFNERKDILTNCPASCGLCLQEPPQPVSVDKCVDNEAFVGEDEHKCHDWIGYNCHQSALDDSSISFNGQLDLIANCPASCGLCVPEPFAPPNPGKCRDTPHFRDEDDNSCRDWRGYNCHMLAVKEKISFQQQKSILKNCPVSCGLCRPPCGWVAGNDTLNNDTFITC